MSRAAVETPKAPPPKQATVSLRVVILDSVEMHDYEGISVSTGFEVLPPTPSNRSLHGVRHPPGIQPEGMWADVGATYEIAIDKNVVDGSWAQPRPPGPETVRASRLVSVSPPSMDYIWFDPAYQCPEPPRGSPSRSEPLPILHGSGFAGVVLPPELARRLFRGICSRNAPPRSRVFWTPSDSDVAELEARIPSLVRTATSDWRYRKQFWRLLFTLGRQYVGVSRGSHRSIYVNFFPWPRYHPHEDDGWRCAPILLCDGGPQYFGLEYDLQSKKLTHISWNAGN